jgi:N-acetylglucosamine-6-phosphate deacetylase
MRMIVGREVETGRVIRVRVEGAVVHAVEPIEGVTSGDDCWVVPALWDLQVNGGRGVSFSDPGLSVEQVARVCEDQRRAGVARFCPTLITASEQALLHGVSTIARACELGELARRMVLGIHLEGPGISELDGYRGAHPREHVRDLTWEEFSRLQQACEGRIVLVTLAPEREGAIDLIERLAGTGVVVALGHTAADAATISAAVVAGARLSTHLGNGIASPLPRHPNPIWAQAAEDRLAASLIGDLAHLDRDTLRVLARAKGVERTILVSDLSPLAGCGPGEYGEWEVREDGRIVVAGTEYLAGAWTSLRRCVENAGEVMGWSVQEAIGCVTENPARLLGKAAPRIELGQPGDLGRIESSEAGRLRFVDGIIGGEILILS